MVHNMHSKMVRHPPPFGTRRYDLHGSMKRRFTLFDLNAQRRKLITSSSVLFLFGAFALIWLLMAGLGWIGLQALQANNQRMEKIVREHNVKIALVLDLRSINRERALIVHKMILSSDPFERDELMLGFRKMATSYLQQRAKLLLLPFMPEEQKAFPGCSRQDQRIHPPHGRGRCAGIGRA